MWRRSRPTSTTGSTASAGNRAAAPSAGGPRAPPAPGAAGPAGRAGRPPAEGVGELRGRRGKWEAAEPVTGDAHVADDHGLLARSACEGGQELARLRIALGQAAAHPADEVAQPALERVQAAARL